ncbi:MAG: hypothetical protein ABSC18_09735, partial [Verrucomicrobiota bacterium]
VRSFLWAKPLEDANGVRRPLQENFATGVASGRIPLFWVFFLSLNLNLNLNLAPNRHAGWRGD